MRYVSTRGLAPKLGFDDVLLAGLATDGGLYVPAAWPTFGESEMAAMEGLDYSSVAARVMAPYVVGSVLEKDLSALAEEAYALFTHKAVAPLTPLAANHWLVELFHGPTLAFKDYALQAVGLMFDRVLHAKGHRITIVGATSGDTGSAAIEACKNKDAVDIFILHPAGRTSEVQRRQMTTVEAKNVHNIEVTGTFDDCQNLVKAMFADEGFRRQMNLSAVNSINWARIMAQVVYYFWAAVQVGAPYRQVAFSVPTGNFGNVFAGRVAAHMGLPVSQFIVGSNRNDVLTRYFETGAMTMEGVVPTLSPSMDIQISSNFERLLFGALGQDGDAVAHLLKQLQQNRTYTVPHAAHADILRYFTGHRLDDAGTARVIRDIYAETGYLIDPHTAVGVHAARASQIDSAIPLLTMATAHPAKFPDAVEMATGVRPAFPSSLKDLFSRTERFTTLDTDLDTIKAFVRENVRK
ncbi:MAG: threonine synthase [Candidatus Marinimicrobia bacterium]|nr:threonine synthase [Candidatus Neomarinimicrobiota bacterium]